MYQDKTLTCKDCGQEFVFTAGEQEFYAEKGFQNEPTRCKACRIARKNSRPANGEAQQREMYETPARSVALRPACLSSRRTTDPSIAASAMLPAVLPAID